MVTMILQHSDRAVDAITSTNTNAARRGLALSR